MNRDELSVTAELAQLDLSEEQAQRLGQEVEQMIEYFRAMQQVDVSALEPTTHVLLKDNRTRSDRQRQNDPDALLENAPEAEDRLYVIPNVL